MSLTDKQREQEEQLLGICSKYSGEYLPAYHGSGSWATTYSNEFILASAQLLMLYKSAGIYMPEYDLLEAFRRHKIRSCRGSEMTISRVRYLIVTHLKNKIAELKKNK